MSVFNGIVSHYIKSKKEELQWKELGYTINVDGKEKYVDVEPRNLPHGSPCVILCQCPYCDYTRGDKWSLLTKYGDKCPSCGKFDSYHKFKEVLESGVYPECMRLDYPVAYHWLAEDYEVIQLRVDGSFIRRTKECKLWKQAVLRRHNNSCSRCGTTSRVIIAHHIKSLSSLIDTPNITKQNYRDDCFGLFNEDNGISLCDSCHGAYNKTFGTEDISKEDLREFMDGFNGGNRAVKEES